MGLIKAALGAAGGVLADQWKEFFYCDSMPADVLMLKGQKRISSRGRSSNTSGEDNIISNGSKIAVNNGQCMLIVESGQVVELCAEPGEYIYDKSTEPSVFGGDLESGLKDMFQQMKERFTFGGDAGKDQRVYYINTKEIMGNKYGTPQELSLKTKDETTGMEYNVHFRCFGEYSYHIVDPITFYSFVAGNAADVYKRNSLDGQMKSELLSALQPAFAKLSAQHLDYTEIMGHTFEVADALNAVLSQKWRKLRGIEIVSFGINSITPREEDEAIIQRMQEAKVLGSQAAYRQGYITSTNQQAIQAAAANEGGAALGLMNMNMAQNMGASQAANDMQMQQLQQMQAQLKAQQEQLEAQKAALARQQQVTPAAATWDCDCGQQGNTGKFCTNCGKPKPQPAASSTWDCPCGQKGNTGNFCTNCGRKRPSAESWTCPNCGQENKGNFCTNCGSKRP